jgi:hypothetical protein
MTTPASMVLASGAHSVPVQRVLGGQKVLATGAIGALFAALRSLWPKHDQGPTIESSPPPT